MQPPTSSNNHIEERLKQSETLLRIAGRMARIGGWAVELPADRVTWSDEVCAIHEVPAGTQPTVEEGIHFYAPEYREKIRKLFTTCVQEGIPFDVELEIVTAKGNRVWVRAIGEAERDASGVIRRVQGAFQDRTESKLAAEKSHRIAEQLTNTLESITDAFFTLDCDWRFTYVNHEAERLLQRSREQLLGRVIWEEFKEAIGSRFYEEYHRAMREGCTVALEAFYAPLAIWVEVKAYPSAEGLAVYFRDVTQRRRYSEELRLNEERLRLLSKTSNNAIWDWDVIGDNVWLNEGYLHLFGFDRAGIKLTSNFWTERIHPDDKKRVLDRLEKALHQAGDDWSDEYRFMRKDGSYAFVLDRGHIIRNANGRAIRMIGIMTDLTERRAAEEKTAEHAALLDKAQEAILVCDLKHQITFWNKSAERLYGWSVEQAMSSSCRELLHLNTDTFDHAMKRVLTHGDWIGELNQGGKGGRSFVVESHWTLVKDNSGQPISVLIINTDITERKKLEQQFLRAQRMESIGTLAGGIAHDLNNVLAPILMSIEMLKLEEQNDERRDVLGTIESSAKRGAEMVKQVLTFARGVEGRRVGLNIEGLLQDIEKMANETFLKSIQVHTIVPPDVWTVSGDPTQIHQVLLNLCVNARDAMPEGGLLTLSAENINLDDSHYLLSGGEGRPGPHVLIQVEDTGTGIAPEILEKIFDPFFTTKELGNGTGLGLSTCLAIVKSHGGFIQVDSELGKGSTFKVYLPAEVKAASKGVPDEIAELPRGNGELILVVDDESAVREITRQTLEAFGYRVVLASDGTEAVGIYARRKAEIDAVLTDLMMPVMDGPTTVQVLRKLNPRIRVITASGLNANRHIQKLASTETKHFLLKPYTAETLLKKVKEVLQENG